MLSRDVLKALSDDTRFRCFEFARASSEPVSVADVAAAVGLHPNTVRPHLERLRDVGLLQVTPKVTGTVGRPQHLYTVALGAPVPGQADALLSGLVAVLANRLHGRDDALEAGREWGRDLGDGAAGAEPAAVLEVTFGHLGFDPSREGSCLTWGRCPFRELAEANPEVICSLHEGMCQGLLEMAGSGRLEAFHPLGSRTPCTVEVATA